MNKYGAKKVRIGSEVWDSQGEYRRWNELLLLQKAGHITRLERQTQYKLVVDGVLICKYKPDFQYRTLPGNELVVEDWKNPVTARKRDFVLVKKLMKALHHVDILVTMK